ncbi:hypothetical protein [Stenotrophomonas sp. NPDC077659]|uniref:hypothetical protein n=1 Tax=Stenotrophomonas sp. NPDC077659 TaxID=3390694 RepID=UPI003D03DFA9
MRRWFATAIDSVALALILSVPDALLREPLAQMLLAVSLLPVACFPVMDTHPGGLLGKRATCTQVVNPQGARLSLRAASRGHRPRAQSVAPGYHAGVMPLALPLALPAFVADEAD